MFSKVARASALLLALPLVTVASPLSARTGGPGAGSCNTGSVQCCQSLQANNAGLTGLVSALVGLLIPITGGQVGINCTPINIIGTGGNNCNAQTVCCEGNNIGGALSLVSVGCSPINLNL